MSAKSGRAANTPSTVPISPSSAESAQALVGGDAGALPLPRAEQLAHVAVIPIAKTSLSA
jgi:hypothetical protein